MSDIKSWSTTAASNNSASPDGWPENMPPSGVNDSAREMMAAIRTWYEDSEWIDLGDAPTYVSASSFTISGDVTTTYTKGRRVKLTDSGTLYGVITASTYSNPNTTISVALDSGSLSGALSAVAGGAARLEGNTPIPIRYNEASDRYEGYHHNSASWGELGSVTQYPVPARNCTLNQEPLSQGESTDTGMSATIWSGDSANPRTIANGLDMATGDFGGLVLAKNRDNANHWTWGDSVRGGGAHLESSSTAAETTNDVDGYISAFTSTGFSVDAGATSDNQVNDSAYDYVAFSFQTTKKVTGTTNRNKAYTCHFNPDMGFSIVGYEGDGVDGHEIPHHLGVEPELSIFKNRDAATDWWVKTPEWNSTSDGLQLNDTLALGNLTNSTTIISDTSVSLDTGSNYNSSTDNIISYHFASVEGVSKIGKYIGTGAVGNYVECGFKPAFVMLKRLTGTGSWSIRDAIRVNGNGYSLGLSSDAPDIEGTSEGITLSENGFYIEYTGTETNDLNDEYLFLAFAETGSDATKAYTDYPYATSADTLSVENGSLVSVANGFNASGQVDTQYQFGSGITRTYGAGHENKHYYVYTDKTGSLGESEYRPLEGWNSRNDADKWGVESPLDATLRTTAKHFDYESETGDALASGEDSGASAWSWEAFNKTSTIWREATTTVSWVQYKFNEPRILKSWRLRESGDTATTPKRFTIEGSNDGYTWTAIDSTYTSADYTGNGASLWGDLHSTSANTSALHPH
jgi:hypothetical protein